MDRKPSSMGYPGSVSCCNGGPAAAAADREESAAIVLAASLKADAILMDDRAGVAAARAKGFAVVGTLGILDAAARQGKVDLIQALDRLRKTSFRRKDGLFEALLRKHRDEGGHPGFLTEAEDSGRRG